MTKTNRCEHGTILTRVIEMMKAIPLVVVMASLSVLTADGQDQEQKPDKSAKAEAVKKLPKLLDLGAHKCIPCKKMAPILVELTKEYKGVFDVEFVDVWQPENKKRALEQKIESIPTQIFFDASGRELWRHVGFLSKEDILKKWKELGFSFKPAPPAGEKTRPGKS